MTGKRKWALGLTSPASSMVALDVPVVSTASSAIRLHDLRENRASISDRIDRSWERAR
jgi:hypothetical protein